MENRITVPNIEKPNTVVILATGGTIAGSGEAGKETGYTSGTLSVDSLVAAIPSLAELANIKSVQICNINSDDITARVWLDIARFINECAKDPNVLGFVITHGTDTMEETAYFLNLTVRTDKPVVLTGSMRPATALSADGAMNLYQSVVVAAAPQSHGRGVLVVFSDRIFSARSVEKKSTYSVMAISANEMGCVGIVRNREINYYEMPGKRHTVESEFSISALTDLPRVSIIYFAVDQDPALITFAAERSEGIVIAGAGAGEFSEEFMQAINALRIPVVVSSRIDDGIITQDSVLCPNTVAANNLSPQKAAILLRLALTRGTNRAELIRIFDEY